MAMSFIISSTSDEVGTKKAGVTTASIRAIRGGHDDVVVINDAPSMAQALNEGVRRAKHDRLCIVHNDVELRPSQYWSDDVLEVIRRRFRVGFLGAAGSKDAFPDGKWYVEGNRMSGAVIHGQFYAPNQQAPNGARALADGRRYAEWVTTYGDFGRVVLLDGVVLMTSKQVLEEIGGFDESRYPEAFHYYDLDATLRAHLAGYHNITLPLMVRHLSLGTYDDKWALARERFLEKWDARLPVMVSEGDGENYTIEALRNLKVA